MGNNQLYERLYYYIDEYLNLIYNYYSKDAVAYIVNYYNLSQQDSTWDNEDVFAGSYERLGDLSGIKFNKINSLPIFFIEEITTAFEATENGYTKDNVSSVVIPHSYGFIPYPGDFVKLEQSFMRPNNNIYPIFIVKGVEISSNTDKRFYKLKIEVEQSRTTDDLDNQVNNNYTFFEYTKNIYTNDNFSILSTMLNNYKTISNNLRSNYDKNCGFYNINI